MNKHIQNVNLIIDAVGGGENIKSATHCVTRLRLSLDNETLVNTEALDNNELVKGFFFKNNQLQIIIGPGLVDKIYVLFLDQTGLTTTTLEETDKVNSDNSNKLQRFVKVLADVFIPILPAIVASGLLMGLNNILTNPGIFYAGKSVLDMHPGWVGISDLINVISSTAFAFLPALVGWSAVKKFGGNPVLGIVLGLILIHPSLMPGPQYVRNPQDVQFWNILGFNIAKIGYQGQVIPVLCASYILAKSEKFLTKYIPEMVQLIFVSPLALLFTGIVTFSFIGPITMQLSNIITGSIVSLFDISPVIAGFVLGGLVSPLVVTGMHHLLLGVNLQMIGTLAYTTIWPIQVMASLGQGAAALAMFFILKNKKVKGVALTAAISAWLGITEPAIFGINIRYKFPFIASMIGAAIAGAITAGAGVKAGSIGISGIPAPLSILTEYWGIYLIAMLVSIVITMLLTFVFSKRSKTVID